MSYRTETSPYTDDEQAERLRRRASGHALFSPGYSGDWWAEQVIETYTDAWLEAGGEEPIEMDERVVARYLAMSLQRPPEARQYRE